jgi:hypothetical protein
MELLLDLRRRVRLELRHAPVVLLVLRLRLRLQLGGRLIALLRLRLWVKLRFGPGLRLGQRRWTVLLLGRRRLPWGFGVRATLVPAILARRARRLCRRYEGAKKAGGDDCGARLKPETW